MPQLFANNARALLASGINDTATSLTVEANKADLFPTANTGTGTVPSANNWYKATIQDSQGNTEIVYVRTRAAGSGIFSNVIRGQEGTLARVFSAGSVVGLRLTALDVQQSINVLSSNNVFTGTNTFAGAVTFNQAVNGSITGNAATVTNGVYTIGNQSITGIKTFQGNTPIIVDRADNSVNALVHYRTTAGSVFAGARSGTAWSIGVSNNLASARTFDHDTLTGDTVASGNITAFSDERLKKDWASLPDDFIDRLAAVKCGTYTRIDTGERQAGVSAQGVRRLLPEVIHEGEDGTLSLAYGNAALVAVIKLAERVLALEVKG